jgi:hypothetical protein
MYVYGYVRAEDASGGLGTGIADAPVTTLAEGDVAALVTPVDEVQPRRASLLAHAGVLDRALEHGPVLPLRFGMVAGTDTVRESLRDPDLRRRLETLDGRVEMAVSAQYCEDVLLREVVSENPQIAAASKLIADRPPAATHFERIRLGELVAQAVEAKREADSAAILAALEPHAVAVHRDAPQTERTVVDAAFLVERDRLPAFDQAVESTSRAGAERMQFKLLGPRPAHSFVEVI